jgi:23S rRNA (cytosine1962-C5)-methyltransferase
LNKGADKRLKQGHCWIYSNEVNIKATPLKSFQGGEQVIIQSSAGHAIGSAFVSPNSLICARLISRRTVKMMDQDLLKHRLLSALSLREQVFAQPYYRLVFGDSDALSGLVVDRFGDVLVVQISTAGMECLKEQIVAALAEVCRPRTIILKNDGKMRAGEGLSSYVEVALGESVEEAPLEENGVRFVAPVIAGQKTGWFFDHRMNRARLRDYVRGRTVLDLFSYVGGWGIQAAAFGAASVTCVDSSPLAMEYVRRNAALNDVQDQVGCLEGDVSDICRDLKEQRQRFDVVIVDPPAFIPRRKDQKAGERAYQRLNQLAMSLLNQEGLLVSASCSMHLSRPALVGLVRDAGQSLEKQLQIVESGTQGPDHPVVPAIPETEYLKALFVRVLPAY